MHYTDPGPTRAQQRELRELALEAECSFVTPTTYNDASEELGILRHTIARKAGWDGVEYTEADAIVCDFDRVHEPTHDRYR